MFFLPQVLRIVRVVKIRRNHMTTTVRRTRRKTLQQEEIIRRKETTLMIKIRIKPRLVWREFGMFSSYMARKNTASSQLIPKVDNKSC